MKRLHVLFLVFLSSLGSRYVVAQGQTDTLSPVIDTLAAPPVDTIVAAHVISDTITVGIASYYADKFEGRRTSSGEPFRQSKMTGAHNSLPLGTWIRVTRLDNGRQVVVRINDRMHPRNPRLVDLSKAAARKLGYIGLGVVTVSVEPLGMNPPPDE
jgi:rare lipoprotein A (peptidoglycan hydrolase)